MGQFHWDPSSYLDLMHDEVPDYVEFQDAVAAATTGVVVTCILELGTGTGETARRLLDIHHGARLIGIDESEAMLEAARSGLPPDLVELHARRLQDALPPVVFDLVVAALTVHHLDGPAKADLFARVHATLRPGGRLVVGDVIVPTAPADAVTPIDPEDDHPDSIEDQLGWMRAAGFEARAAWERRDLAVLVADRS
jgi:tRNA (cmo5U34)-methyltransferase